MSVLDLDGLVDLTSGEMAGTASRRWEVLLVLTTKEDPGALFWCQVPFGMSLCIGTCAIRRSARLSGGVAIRDMAACIACHVRLHLWEHRFLCSSARVKLLSGRV